MNENTSNGVSIPANISDGVCSKDKDLHNLSSFYNDTWPANQKNLHTLPVNEQHHGTSTEEHYFAHSGIECEPLSSFTPLINIPTPTPLIHINLGPKSSSNAELSPTTTSTGHLHNSSLGSSPSANSIPFLTCTDADYLLHTKTETPLPVVNSDHLDVCIKTEPSQQDTASSPPIVQFSMTYKPLLDVAHCPERVFHFTGSKEDDRPFKKSLGANDHMCTLSKKASELESSKTNKIPYCGKVLNQEHVDLEVLQVVDLFSGKEGRPEEFTCLSAILASADTIPEATHDSDDDEGTVEVLKVVHLKSRITVDPSFHSVVAKLIDIPKERQESRNNSSAAKVLPLKISQNVVESQDPSNDLCKGRTDVRNLSESSFNKSNNIDCNKSALSIRSCEVKVYDVLQRFPEFQKRDLCKLAKPVLHFRDIFEKKSSTFPLKYSELPKIMHKEPIAKNKESISYDQKSVVPRMTLNEATDATSNLNTVPTLSVLYSLPVTKPDQLVAIPAIKSEQITALTITKKDPIEYGKANLAASPVQMSPAKQESIAALPRMTLEPSLPSADSLSIAVPSFTQTTTFTDLDSQPVKMAEVQLSTMPDQTMAIPTIKSELTIALTKQDPNTELAKANLAVTTQPAQISPSPRKEFYPSLASDVPLLIVPSHVQSTTTSTTTTDFPVGQAANTTEVPVTVDQSFVPYRPSSLKPWPTFSKPISTEPPLPLEAPPPLPPLPPPLHTPLLQTPPILKPLLPTPQMRKSLLPTPPRSPAEVRRMRKELVARHTYCSNDPEEKADNCSRGWDVLRFAKTSEEKFRQVRRRWGNPPLPNLNRDLSYRFMQTSHVVVFDKNVLPTLTMSVEDVLAKYGGTLAGCKLISDDSDSRPVHRKENLEHMHSRYTHKESQTTNDFRSDNDDSRPRHGNAQHRDSQSCGESRSEHGDSRNLRHMTQSTCRGLVAGNKPAVKRKRSCDDDTDQPAAKRVRLIPCTQVYATKLNQVEMAVERVGHYLEMPYEMMTANGMQTAETRARRRALLKRHRARAARSERVYAEMREAHASAIAELELFRSFYQDRGEEKSNFYMTEDEATEILEQERYYSDITHSFV